MSVWKGRITESLARFYIRDVLCPKLEKEGWFKVLFFLDISASKHDYHEYRDKYRSIRIILLDKGIYPSQEFLDKCEKVNDLLKQMSDGFLLKFRKTGEKMKPMKELVSGLEGARRLKWIWSDGWDKYEYFTHEVEVDETTEIPIVTGEIEIVEVKSNKGILSKVQKEDYSNLVKNGFPLRLLHVSIVSFAKNHFEVKEKLLRTINEVKKCVRAEGIRKILA